MAKEASSPQPDLIDDPGLAINRLSMRGEDEGNPSTARNNENFVFVPGQLVESGSSSLSSSTDFLNVKHTNSDNPTADFNAQLTATPIRIEGDAHTPFRTSSTGTPNELNVAATSTPKKVSSGSHSSSTSGAGPEAGTLDRDWRIRYRQFLACMLSEPVLIDYFEKPFEMSEALEKYRVEFEYKAVTSP